MFTEVPMRERSQTDIQLPGVSAAGVKHLLDYIYTSKLSLSLANVQDVLSAASHLQVPKVVEACSNYLQAQLDVENCVDVVTIAETYSLAALRAKVYRFMSENLADFSRRAEFFHRLSVGQLQHLLESDFPVDVSEECVLEILLDWLDVRESSDNSSRMAHAHRLLRSIDFVQIHPAHVSAVLERKLASSSSMPKSFLSRVQAMSEEQYGGELSSTAATHLVNSRGMEEAVVKVGGFGSHGVTNQITYCLPSTGRWRHLASVPHVECCNFGTAVLRNELFVVGGCFNQSLQENIHPFGFRYDPRNNRWTTIAPMKRERCRFSITVYGKSLYAFGGVSESTGNSVHANDSDDELPENGGGQSTSEKYDAETDVWTPIAAFPNGALHRSQHASVRFQNVILVSGGLGGGHHDLVLDTLLVYHPANDIWETAARRMPTPRADHIMAVWRDRIYFCGGWYEDDASGDRVLVDTVDVYDLASDTWTVETRLPTPRYHAGMAIVGDRLYVIGGFRSDGLFDSRQATASLIECYDLKAGEWRDVKRYPQEVWEHACVSLYIPRCRDDMEIVPIAHN